MIKYWAGIGSRSTPEHVQKIMTSLAKELCDMGYCLRSGNADGADQAFAKGVYNENAQIWLPWQSFNIGFQLLHPQHDYKILQVNDRDAFESVDTFHPSVFRLGMNGIKLMARNYRQIIGLNESNSQFVVCWTTDGKEVGGTAQAIRIARHFHIPVYNLFDLTKDQILKEINKLNLLN